jgi:hypothetical protein
MLLSRLGDDFAVGGLPQANRIVWLLAKHEGVVPPPHCDVLSAGRPCNSHQVTGRHPLGPRRWELGRVPDGSYLTLCPDLADMLLDAQRDGTAELG